MFDTSVIIAKLKMNATYENAYGDGNKTVMERMGYQQQVQKNMLKQA